jgi:uncharacterized membrane protein YjjB (DUF3815 family)
MTKFEIIQIIAGTIGTLGFTVLFNIRGKRLIFTSIGGFLSWTLFVIFSKFIISEPLNYFIVAFLMTAYAEIVAMIIKSPTTIFITTTLVPLIPGSSLYYTMANAFTDNKEGFIEKGMHTLSLAAALAIGIIIATAITKITKDFLRRKKGET